MLRKIVKHHNIQLFSQYTLKLASIFQIYDNFYNYDLIFLILGISPLLNFTVKWIVYEIVGQLKVILSIAHIS